MSSKYLHSFNHVQCMLSYGLYKNRVFDYCYLSFILISGFACLLLHLDILAVYFTNARRPD